MPDSVVVRVYDDFDFIKLEDKQAESDVKISYVDPEYIVSLETDQSPIVLEEYSSPPITVDVEAIIQYNNYNTGGSTPANVAFTYNSDGRIETSTKLGVVSTYTYNAGGQLETISNENLTKTFTYDDDGRLEAITIS